MDYREYSPSPRLASIVDCFWTLEGHAADLSTDMQPVLPDGRPELIVHFGDPFDRLAVSGDGMRQPAIIFAGQLTAQLVLRPTGRVSVLGVRFHADGAPALIGAPHGVHSHAAVATTIVAEVAGAEGTQKQQAWT